MEVVVLLMVMPVLLYNQHHYMVGLVIMALEVLIGLNLVEVVELVQQVLQVKAEKENIF